MKDLYDVGGVPVLMKALLDGGYLHGDCITVTGKTIAENLRDVVFPKGQDVVRPSSEQLHNGKPGRICERPEELPIQFEIQEPPLPLDMMPLAYERRHILTRVQSTETFGEDKMPCQPDTLRLQDEVNVMDNLGSEKAVPGVSSGCFRQQPNTFPVPQRF